MVFDGIRGLSAKAPDEKTLIQAAVVAMVAQLDPYSIYIPQNTPQQQPSSGEIGDVGVKLRVHYDQIQVVSPTYGSVAARAGILPGDIILDLDGHSVAGRTVNQILAV